MPNLKKKEERKRNPAHSCLFPVRAWHAVPALQIRFWEGWWCTTNHCEA